MQAAGFHATDVVERGENDPGWDTGKEGARLMGKGDAEIWQALYPDAHSHEWVGG